MPGAKVMSIVIPSLNTPAHYIECALESVAQQTVGADAVEVIVMDDHSDSDGIEQLTRALNGIHRRFPRLTVTAYPNGLPPGLGNARNSGAARATADFIGCLDADDCLREDAIERSLDKHRQGAYDLVFSDYEKRDERLKDVMYEARREEIYRAHCRHKGTLLDPLVHGSFTEHFTVLRRSRLLQIGYRNVECPDYDLPLRLSAVSEGVNFGHVPETLYLYRHNPRSLSNRVPGSVAAANAAVEGYILQFLHKGGYVEAESVKLFHEALNSPSFFDIVMNDQPVEVPWFDRQSRKHLFARYFVQEAMVLDRHDSA